MVVLIFVFTGNESGGCKTSMNGFSERAMQIRNIRYLSWLFLSIN